MLKVIEPLTVVYCSYIVSKYTMALFGASIEGPFVNKAFSEVLVTTTTLEKIFIPVALVERAIRVKDSALALSHTC